jgi:hypothetical protein
MTREHVVRFTVLTACIFGFSMYMQKGTWIFPFPLYEGAMLAAVLALYIVDRKKPGILGFLAILWAFLQVCASDFILEFFIRAEDAASFYESLITDYLLLSFAVFFLLWGVLVSLKLHRMPLKLLAVAGCFGFFAAFIFNAYLWAMIPLSIWLASLFFDEKDPVTGLPETTIHRNVLFLFTFFFFSKYLTIALLGN